IWPDGFRLTYLRSTNTPFDGIGEKEPGRRGRLVCRSLPWTAQRKRLAAGCTGRYKVTLNVCLSAISLFLLLHGKSKLLSRSTLCPYGEAEGRAGVSSETRVVRISP